MKIQVFIVRIVAVALIVFGSVMWQSRNNYIPGATLSERERDALTPLTSGSASDLSEICSVINDEGGWVLFIVEMNAIADATPRRFFQTASEPYGMFIEYDPSESAMLRLGLGLGPEKWNTDSRIRTVRRDEEMTIAIGITAQETQVATNVVRKRLAWPSDFAPVWRCDAVEFGQSARAFSSAATCDQCEVSVRYLAGSGTNELHRYMDSYTNMRRHHVMSWLGTCAFLGGILVLAVERRIRAKVGRIR